MVFLTSLFASFFGLFNLGKIMASLVDVISPLLKWAVEMFAGFLSVLVEGLKDMLDNWKSIVFVATLSALSGAAVAIHNHTEVPKKCEKIIKELRKDYKFVPRKDTSKGFDVRSIFPW